MLVPSDERAEKAKRRVGRVLAEKWRLERLIGMGGMAAVYAARHVNNDREVALKLLHRELAAKEDIKKRFLREGYIANKVVHPGVVQILDDGTDEEGGTFLVMELFRGETLQARAAAAPGGKLGAMELLPIVEKLLDVLAAAHDAQVVHRDLKPENVFVTDDGSVKVLDFGIARLAQPRGDFSTQAGTLVGTPNYMPPEQIAGRNDEVDARSDLWAVGAMMFTLLSGRFVHEAKQANALLLQAMTSPARKLVEVVPEANPEIARVVDTALSFTREARYPSARAMQEAVREAIAAGGARAGAPRLSSVSGDLASASPSTAPRVGRRTAIGVALGALGLGVLGALGATALAALRRVARAGDPEIPPDAAADRTAVGPIEGGADGGAGGDDDGGDDAGDDDAGDDDAGDDDGGDDGGDEYDDEDYEEETEGGPAVGPGAASALAPRPPARALPHRPPVRRPPQTHPRGTPRPRRRRRIRVPRPPRP